MTGWLLASETRTCQSACKWTPILHLKSQRNWCNKRRQYVSNTPSFGTRKDRRETPLSSNSSSVDRNPNEGVGCTHRRLRCLECQNRCVLDVAARSTRWTSALWRTPPVPTAALPASELWPEAYRLAQGRHYLCPSSWLLLNRMAVEAHHWSQPHTTCILERQEGNDGETAHRTSRCRMLQDVSQSIVWWPGVMADIRDMVEHCVQCAQEACPWRKLLMTTVLPEYPWQVVGSDLLLVEDHFSRYSEVVRMKTTTSLAIVTALKAIFACHGTPERARSDNGPQYASEQIRHFSESYELSHITSSPQNTDSIQFTSDCGKK